MTDTAKILIVDDSRIFRTALEGALAGEDDLAVAGSVFSGEKALEFIRQSAPDLVTLDVEMPGLGGLGTLDAIQRINATRPPGQEIGVLMVSAFTCHGADVTIKALQAGAFDFVTKPCGDNATDNAGRLRAELSQKIRCFLARRRRQVVLSRGGPTAGRREASPNPCPPMPGTTNTSSAMRAILIGASTGGPRALSQLLPDLTARTQLPILIVQHMPAEFTHSLAENLSRVTRRPVTEAADGAAIEPGGIYLAPGGRHLIVRPQAQGRIVTSWSDQCHECGCRPSANVLFRSAAAALQGRAVGLVLTGMGNDGTAGLGALKRAGGYVIAQDEASSVVWGMPGSAVQAGVVDAVLPLAEIPAAVACVVRGREAK